VLCAPNLFLLVKSTSFPNSAKKVSVDKIPSLLQAFEVVIFAATTSQIRI